MMRKSLKVYETYQEMLNEDIKTLFMVRARAHSAGALPRKGLSHALFFLA